jgi:3-deoxy-7-phosphoheptulonate synthase
MTEKIEDRNVEGIMPLISPRAVKAAQPLTARAADVVLETRRAIRDVLHGRDRNRLLVVVGPCSIHDPDAALDYARRLVRIAEATRDRLIIVMRTYFEKPRRPSAGRVSSTTRTSTARATSRPAADRAQAPARDQRARAAVRRRGARPDHAAVHLRSLSWASIGARTIESQTHREMASGSRCRSASRTRPTAGLEVRCTR